MPTVEELQQKLSNETMMRVFGDNEVKNIIINETVVRNEADDTIKIKIANESTDRASKDTAILQKLSEEVQSRVKEIESLKRRIEVLEQIVDFTDKSTADKPTDDKPVVETTEDKLMINQEMFVRQLNMLKRSAKFILDNLGEIEKKEETNTETENKLRDFFRHLNNLQLTYENLINNKDKYTLTEETKECISEIEDLKVELEKLEVKYDTESLFNDRQAGSGGDS